MKRGETRRGDGDASGWILLRAAVLAAAMEIWLRAARRDTSLRMLAQRLLSRRALVWLQRAGPYTLQEGG